MVNNTSKAYLILSYPKQKLQIGNKTRRCLADVPRWDRGMSRSPPWSTTHLSLFLLPVTLVRGATTSLFGPHVNSMFTMYSAHVLPSPESRAIPSNATFLFLIFFHFYHTFSQCDTQKCAQRRKQSCSQKGSIRFLHCQWRKLATAQGFLAPRSVSPWGHWLVCLYSESVKINQTWGFFWDR